MPNKMLYHSRSGRGGKPRLTTCHAALLLTFATLRGEVTPPSATGVERPAHISFLSVPDGATVRLNGRQLDGTTPLEFQEVPPGISVIEFEKDGYERLRIQQFWAPGAVARFDVALIALATPTFPPSPTSPADGDSATDARKVEALPPAVRLPEAPPPKATASSSARVAPTVAAAKTTTVSLISQPAGAKVVVNGTALDGATPLDKIALPPGRATIEFHLENYQPMTAKRSWKAGASDTVTVELVPLPARISVITTPGGATVKVNGVTLEGQTPIEAALVPAGETQLVVELENHMPAVERRNLTANTDTRVEIQMKALDAIVRFESEPPGATIIVNGEVLPMKCPAGPMPLPPQHARVEFQLAGHAPKIVERDWAPNGVDAIMVKLTPNPGRAQFQSPAPWDGMTVDGAPVAVQANDWLPLPAGPHRVLAQQGNNAAETDFVVPPGSDVVVALNWANKRPGGNELRRAAGVEINPG